MFVIFLVYPTSPKNSVNSKTETFISPFVFFLGFLAFDHNEIRCLPKKEVSPQDCLLIPKVNYRTVYPEKLFLWLPFRLLASEKVVGFFHLRDGLNFFLCFRTKVVLHRTVHLDSKIYFQNVTSWLILERTKFGRNKIVFVINSHQFCRRRF